MEPADNRQLPGRPWAPGSGQACRKILGFALIPNCELKFGPVHNAPGTWLHKGGPAVPPQAPRSRRPGASPPPAQRGRPVGVCGGPPPTPPGSTRPLCRAQGCWRAGPSPPAPPATAGPLWPSSAVQQRGQVPPRQGRQMGFIRESDGQLLSIFTDEEAGGSGLKLPHRRRAPSRFLPARRWEACPQPSPRERHLPVTFPRVGAQPRWRRKAVPVEPPTAAPDPDPGTGGRGVWKPPSPKLRWVVYFCFPAARLQLDYSARTSQPEPSPPPAIKCGFGALLFFSHPSCF